MNRRRISILAIDEDIAEFFKAELYSIFNNTIEIKYYTLSMTPLPYIYDSDLVLYTDPSILIKFMNNIKSNCPVLMMKRTISRYAMSQVANIPRNSNCLVANINSFMANETLTTIYQLGFTDFNLFPYYEGCDYIPENIDYIICHIDYGFLPDIDAEKIIIGSRIFDINTVLDILAILDISSDIAENIIIRYSLRIPNMWKGVNYALENKRILSSQWKVLLNELSMAVMVIDEKDKISIINSNIVEIFDERIKEFENQNLNSLVEQFPSLRILLSKNDIDKGLFVYNGKKLIITIRKVIFNQSYYGKIILVENYSDVVKVQQKIHKKLIGRGHYSKHTFESIIGVDDKMKDCVEISKKISNSNSSILIFGESGTGKELIAGSIHNYSDRKGQPFVAVNCAALPDNLLESELFGYEEGAFTGAKKGGKIGLFERANNGTLFLDEIGEIPLGLQARLLRVLQEREIMRVGGDSIIKIDVRIIAATNKDLLKMVESGEFRKDLFFRLNIFQIDIPPLRERPGDIPLLIQYFLNQYSNEKRLSKTFIEFCKKYSWPGNIRELQNVIEYMVTISDNELSPESLPSYLKKRELLEFQMDDKEILSGEIFTLKIIKKLNDNGYSSGRRSISNYFNKRYYEISEIEIRKRIDALQDRGYISFLKGPKGCEITAKGNQFLANILKVK